MANLILNSDNPYQRATIWDYSPDPSLVDRQPLFVNPSERDEYYTVKDGDDLTQIAGKPEIYGNSKLWWFIYDNNSLENPWAIEAGDLLRIPPKVNLNLPL